MNTKNRAIRLEPTVEVADAIQEQIRQNRRDVLATRLNHFLHAAGPEDVEALNQVLDTWGNCLYSDNVGITAAFLMSIFDVDTLTPPPVRSARSTGRREPAKVLPFPARVQRSAEQPCLRRLTAAA